MTIPTKELAALIDHTLLKAEAKEEQILQLCREAKDHGFASVCIHPAWVETAAKVLHGSAVKVCTVIGFPLGANTTATKVFETREAVAKGAREIDMVINVGWLKEGRYAQVEEEIAEVVRAACDVEDVLVKVILETAYLTQEEIATACRLAVDAGAHFVKTSTGFGPRGATTEDVALMRRTVGPRIGVKASGGIRSKADAIAMVEAGASRIGTSSGVAIVAG